MEDIQIAIKRGLIDQKSSSLFLHMVLHVGQIMDSLVEEEKGDWDDIKKEITFHN
jgi:hypothetical protein